MAHVVPGKRAKFKFFISFKYKKTISWPLGTVLVVDFHAKLKKIVFLGSLCQFVIANCEKVRQIGVSVSQLARLASPNLTKTAN
jgi:hypothetical protein